MCSDSVKKIRVNRNQIKMDSEMIWSQLLEVFFRPSGAKITFK
jgi:hypothetical protein